MDEAPEANENLHELIQRLAERVGAHAHVSTIFGEPVDRGDVTVIPVARAGWGFGAGSNSAQERQTGGGGGGLVAPLGYIEVRPAGARFRPVWDPTVLLFAAGALGLGLGVLRAARQRRAG